MLPPSRDIAVTRYGRISDGSYLIARRGRGAVHVDERLAALLKCANDALSQILLKELSEHPTD